MAYKLLLFDLDGTLLRSDKTLSPRTLSALQACRKKRMAVGISTSRSEKNCDSFLGDLMPEYVISCGGALLRSAGEILYQAEFSAQETERVLRIIHEICGADCEITVDTVQEHYWNYKLDPRQWDKSWGETVYTDFAGFCEPSLKICAQTADAAVAERLRKALSRYDSSHFTNSDWYKFTPKTATKEQAILKLCALRQILPEEIIAFGDDDADIGMLRLCGRGIAMGNAIDAVKAAADAVIGSNDADGIAQYIEEKLLKEK